MPRPKCCRRIAEHPRCHLFKPAGAPACGLEEVIIGLDELEAIRLADLEGLYQEQAALRMKVSRQTFGRIVDEARHKVARALIEGKILRIEGGDIEMSGKRTFTCVACQHVWEIPNGIGRPAQCPACKSASTHRIPENQGAQGAGGCRRRCRRGQAGE